MTVRTRSQQTLTGGIRDHLLRSESSNSDEFSGMSTTANNADIGSLIALMTENLSKLTELNAGASGSNRSSTSNQNTEAKMINKIDDCPIKRIGTSLEAWTEEVLLWDEVNCDDKNDTIVKKYLKFVDSVRKSEGCQDVQNLVEVEIVENQSFNKKEKNVIQTIVKKIKEKLGQSDLEKCSEAWVDFINIQQQADETAKSFVSRFEKAESQLRNVNIIIPNKALAIHLMNKSCMESQSKEMF